MQLRRCSIKHDGNANRLIGVKYGAGLTNVKNTTTQTATKRFCCATAACMVRSTTNCALALDSAAWEMAAEGFAACIRRAGADAAAILRWVLLR